jgi:hypothetical protein
MFQHVIQVHQVGNAKHCAKSLQKFERFSTQKAGPGNAIDSGQTLRKGIRAAKQPNNAVELSEHIVRLQCAQCTKDADHAADCIQAVSNPCQLRSFTVEHLLIDNGFSAVKQNTQSILVAQRADEPSHVAVQSILQLLLLLARG